MEVVHPPDFRCVGNLRKKSAVKKSLLDLESGLGWRKRIEGGRERR